MIFLLQARPVKADLSTWYVSLTALTALEVTTKVESNYVKKSRYSSSKLQQYIPWKDSANKIPMIQWLNTLRHHPWICQKEAYFLNSITIFLILGKVSDNLKQISKILKEKDHKKFINFRTFFPGATLINFWNFLWYFLKNSILGLPRY